MNNNDIRRSKKMKVWKRKIRRRDNYTCQICGVRRTKYNRRKVKLHVHHIVRFIDNKDRRYDLYNGITLCESCHRKTYGKEEKFADEFNKIVASKYK